MNFENAKELIMQCQEQQIKISEAMLRREVILFNVQKDEAISRMAASYAIMKKAIRSALEENLQSMGGLIGGESKKIYQKTREKGSVCGDILAKAISYGVGVLEVNASMGLIVAAPTAGSSGVIPGVFASVQEAFDLSDEAMVMALFNAGAIGYLVTRNATVSGAEGGCQAEVGTASAMAASAVCELMGGTNEQCLDAASTALTNVLGLVCDPIAGLVEAPCQKRNAMGAANALISAEISLCRVPHIIPFDETVEAMHDVGKRMPTELRETAMGGIAATPTGCQLCKKVFNE